MLLYVRLIETSGHRCAKYLDDTTSAGYDVELLDAAENPGGLSAGWRTKDGKPVEAGMKGFWYHVRPHFRSSWSELHKKFSEM